MKTCKICGKETQGSVGTSEIKWSFLCQTCKNEEDSILANKLRPAKAISIKPNGGKNGI